MFTADRSEFDRQVSLICAAWNVPLADRGEAFWNAFNKLSLIEFSRIVEHVLGADGPEKMPTVPVLWAIRKKLKTRTNFAPNSRHNQFELLTEAALGRWQGQLSDWQRFSPACAWSYIVRNPGDQNCEVLGVIIERDLKDPVKYPERRLLASEYRQDDAA